MHRLTHSASPSGHDSTNSPEQQYQQPGTRVPTQAICQVILAAMLIALSVIAFWPSPVDQPVQGQLAAVLDFLHRNGIPAWFNYKFVEASANVALFVPLGIVSSLAFPEKCWWQVGAFGLLISGCMELGQLLFLHNRFSTPQDLVTNASGAVIGALLTGWALKRLRSATLG